MNTNTQNVETFKYRARPLRLATTAVAAVLSVVTLVSVLAPPAAAQGGPPITLASLRGSWALTLVGNTGCGISSMYVTFTLNASGVDNNATIIGHSTGCTDATTSGLTFEIHQLNPDGSGTAGLSCGPSCGWELMIQVERANEGESHVFTVADVSHLNPLNVLAGTAIRKSH